MMKYFALCLIVFTVIFCSISKAQDQPQYFTGPPDNDRYNGIYTRCFAVLFDASYDVNPYDFARTYGFLKFDPRIENLNFPFSIFRIEYGINIYSAMSAVREDSSVLLVNPIYRDESCFPTYVFNELIINFNEDVGADLRDSLLSAFGLVIETQIYPSYVVKITGKRNKTTKEIGDELFATGYFQWAYPNYIYLLFTDTMKGDMNIDYKVDIEDLMWLINDLYINNSEFIGLYILADFNCDHVVGIEDIVRMVNYIYRGQPLVAPE